MGTFLHPQRICLGCETIIEKLREKILLPSVRVEKPVAPATCEMSKMIDANKEYFLGRFKLKQSMIVERRSPAHKYPWAAPKLRERSNDEILAYLAVLGNNEHCEGNGTKTTKFRSEMYSLCNKCYVSYFTLF